MSKRWAQGARPALALVALLAEAASAELLHTTVGARIIAAGGHGDKPPDELVSAPNSNGGYFERMFGEYVFVVEGDRFPARVGMGVGLRVVLPGYGPGSPVTVMVESTAYRTSSWDLTVDPDGEIEFGTLPADGEALTPGRYVLTVLDGKRNLMSFAFRVESEMDDGLCAPAVS